MDRGSHGTSPSHLPSASHTPATHFQRQYSNVDLPMKTGVNSFDMLAPEPSPPRRRCKSYRADRSYMCIWGKRRTAGHDMQIMRKGPHMSIDVPTTRVFRVPANLMYWGAPIPAHVPGDFQLKLEDIRRMVRPRLR
jgi:hypothetical protein